MVLNLEQEMTIGERLKLVFFNLTFYPLFVLITLIFLALFVLPLALLRFFIGWRKTLFLVRSLIRIYGLVITRGLTFPFVKTAYIDAERGHRTEACIYVCNHRASSDAFLAANLRGEGIQIVNQWPFKIPFIGWVAKIAGYLNVRSMPFEEFEVKMSRLLKEGVSVVAFPEGSRSIDSNLRQFNGAVFRVALKTKVPVVPICLSGNQYIPKKGSALLHPGKVEMHKMPAIHWHEYQSMSPFKFKNHVRALIQKKVDALEKNEFRL